jgi:hypothetical protein
VLKSVLEARRNRRVWPKVVRIETHRGTAGQKASSELVCGYFLDGYHLIRLPAMGSFYEVCFLAQKSELDIDLYQLLDQPISPVDNIAENSAVRLTRGVLVRKPIVLDAVG